MSDMLTEPTLLPPSDNDSINLVVKRLDDGQVRVSVAKTGTVSLIIEELARQCAHRVEDIRLIFQGRCLRTDQPVQETGLQDGSVLHMVTRMPRLSNPPTASPESPNQNTFVPPTNFASSSTATANTSATATTTTFLSDPILGSNINFANPLNSAGPASASTIFRTLGNGGLMLGTLRVEGDSTDPNMIQSIINSITAAMQQATSTVASTTGATTSSTSNDGTTGDTLVSQENIGSGMATNIHVNPSSSSSSSSTGSNLSAPTSISALLPRSTNFHSTTRTLDILTALNGDIQGVIDLLQSVRPDLLTTTNLSGLSDLSAMEQDDGEVESGQPNLVQFRQMLMLLESLFVSLIFYCRRLMEQTNQPAANYTNSSGMDAMRELNAFIIGLRRLRLFLFNIITLFETMSVSGDGSNGSRERALSNRVLDQVQRVGVFGLPSLINLTRTGQSNLQGGSNNSSNNGSNGGGMLPRPNIVRTIATGNGGNNGNSRQASHQSAHQAAHQTAHQAAHQATLNRTPLNAAGEINRAIHEQLRNLFGAEASIPSQSEQATLRTEQTTNETTTDSTMHSSAITLLKMLNPRTGLSQLIGDPTGGIIEEIFNSHNAHTEQQGSTIESESTAVCINDLLQFIQNDNDTGPGCNTKIPMAIEQWLRTRIATNGTVSEADLNKAIEVLIDPLVEKICESRSQDMQPLFAALQTNVQSLARSCLFACLADRQSSRAVFAIHWKGFVQSIQKMISRSQIDAESNLDPSQHQLTLAFFTLMGRGLCNIFKPLLGRISSSVLCGVDIGYGINLDEYATDSDDNNSLLVQQQQSQQSSSSLRKRRSASNGSLDKYPVAPAPGSSSTSTSSFKSFRIDED